MLLVANTESSTAVRFYEGTLILFVIMFVLHAPTTLCAREHSATCGNRLDAGPTRVWHMVDWRYQILRNDLCMGHLLQSVCGLLVTSQ